MMLVYYRLVIANKVYKHIATENVLIAGRNDDTCYYTGLFNHTDLRIIYTLINMTTFKDVFS
jgi:hypothetical protein